MFGLLYIINNSSNTVINFINYYIHLVRRRDSWPDDPDNDPAVVTLSCGRKV